MVVAIAYLYYTHPTPMGGWSSVPVKTVEHFDLSEFVKQPWYEIARLPNWFEPQDASDITAVYRAGERGQISVTNSMWVAGRRHHIEGTAIIDPAEDDGSNSKLLVDFHNTPFGTRGQYWVIKVADDYRYIVVTGRNRKTLWIMSRRRNLAESDLIDILNYLDTQGFHIGPDTLIYPRQK